MAYVQNSVRIMNIIMSHNDDKQLVIYGDALWITNSKNIISIRTHETLLVQHV